MALYLFVWGAFAWTVTLAALWPVNIALARLALFIWQGNPGPGAEEDEDEGRELWIRSGLATFVFGVASLVFVVLDHLVVNGTEMPAGPIHLVLYFCLLGVAVWIFMYFYSIEDFFDALGLLTIYVALPLFVLYAANWMLGFWNPLLNLVYLWLKDPSA